MAHESVLVKASLTHLDSLETFTVLWNPASYRVERRNALVAPSPLGGAGAPQFAAGGAERFSTTFLLDSSESEGEARDLRARVEILERWALPSAATGLPPRLLFHWGSFRFRGVVEDLGTEWERFDPDGTPIRVWVSLVLRR
jgi:hypothetical protein